uniref:Uncharacterized protein AlNc14C4G655 n=1 Tax=Albugo laibachii Nc14 TaxID=890382 RepID=F0W0L4_9STRA|nr:conserved hypothetical protein [Albugo laibachii Nc14]|eukprot:CCA14586.1 conserved hypothetical protein [Albugo laibachii Nc14]
MNQASDVSLLHDSDWKFEAAPTLELQKYDSFVRWVLEAEIDSLISLDALPEELKAVSMALEADISAKECNGTNLELMRASVEADLEAALDDISISRRQKHHLFDQITVLEGDLDVLCEQIALSEARIRKHLQDRDLAISERYSVEKEIEDIEAKRRYILAQESSFFSFGRTLPLDTEMNVDIEKIHQEIAAVKVDSAQIQTELDKRYNHLAKQEKECVLLKLEIAKAKEFEDNFRVRIANVNPALQKPQKIRFFGAAAAVAFTRKHKSARCPQPL